MKLLSIYPLFATALCLRFGFPSFGPFGKFPIPIASTTAPAAVASAPAASTQGQFTTSAFVTELQKVAKSGYLKGLGNLLDPRTLSDPSKVLGTLVNATTGPPVRFFLYRDPK